jgi:hypothetical protein
VAPRASRPRLMPRSAAQHAPSGTRCLRPGGLRPARGTKALPGRLRPAAPPLPPPAQDAFSWVEVGAGMDPAQPFVNHDRWAGRAWPSAMRHLDTHADYPLQGDWPRLLRKDQGARQEGLGPRAARRALGPALPCTAPHRGPEDRRGAGQAAGGDCGAATPGRPRRAHLLEGAGDPAPRARARGRGRRPGLPIPGHRQWQRRPLAEAARGEAPTSTQTRTRTRTHASRHPLPATQA